MRSKVKCDIPDYYKYKLEKLLKEARDNDIKITIEEQSCNKVTLNFKNGFVEDTASVQIVEDE